MKRTEILTLLLSIAAIIISLITPALVYRYLQNDVRVQQIKAEGLRVTQTARISNIAVSKDHDGEIGVPTGSAAFYVAVENICDLPIEDVEIVVQYSGQEENFFDAFDVTSHPPMEIEAVPNICTLRVALKQHLSPGEKIDLLFERRIGAFDDIDIDYTLLSLWARSEATPMHLILFPGDIQPAKQDGEEQP